MDILILVAAVLLIGLFCYKNVPTLSGGIVCSVILMIIYKMDITAGLFDTYMGGLVGFMKSWMILFFLGALFGKLLDITGGSDSLARVILNLVGPKNVSLGVCIFTAILAMAGISSFISLFICYPIALKLCRKANINRASVIAGYSLGLNFGLAVPWVPVTNNVLCASYFGTDVSAGGFLGLFVSIVFIVVGMLYIKWYEKRLAAAGKGYLPAYGTGALEEEESDDAEAKKGPHWVLSVIPMLIPILVLNIFKVKVELALLCGVLAVVVLQFKYLPRNWDANRKAVSDSISMCMTTLINAAAIVGFGSVVQNCPGYATAVESILSYEGSPLMITFVATNLIAGIAGSSSAGLVLAAPVLQQAATMTNAAVFHRTTVLASLGLDSLPNAGFLQTECTVAGVKFKDVYFPVIFALTVVLTILRCLLYMGLAAAFGIA